MDNQRINSPLHYLTYFCQGKTIEELKQSLLYTTLELETTRLQAQEELKNRDDLLTHIKDLLSKAVEQRDEAQKKYQNLFQQQKHPNQQPQQQNQPDPHSGISSIDDEQNPHYKNGFSSSDCEESIVSSPIIDPISLSPENLPQPEKPLPENGKFLQAVMKAGPLLQTLLLAGPLPQWRHPPPPLECFEIPPVTIPSSGTGSANYCKFVNKKRGSCEDSDSCETTTKYQRVGSFH